MDARDVVKTLALSPAMQSSVALGMQMGLPWLEKKKNMLLMSFRPHRESHEKGGVSIYRHQYEAVWAYPFTRLVLFRDLTLEQDIDVAEPICIIPDDKMLSSVKYRLNELYDECSRILTVWDEKGDVSEVMLRKYQQKYLETVERLRLEELYG